MVGAGSTVGTGAGATGAAAALDGIFSFCPTLILVVLKPFAASMALTVEPWAFAILMSESPDLTV